MGLYHSLNVATAVTYSSVPAYTNLEEKTSKKFMTFPYNLCISKSSAKYHVGDKKMKMVKEELFFQGVRKVR